MSATHTRRKRRTKVVDGVTIRECSKCEIAYPIEEGFYRARRVPRGNADDFQYHCKRCTMERVTEAQRTKYRERQKSWHRNWRERNRDKVNENRRRYWERLKRDPVRYARALEGQRMAYRLRQERENGRDLDDIRTMPAVMPPDAVAKIALPAKPLASLIAERIEAAQRDRPTNSERRALLDAPDLGGYTERRYSVRTAVCEWLGLTERTLRGWESGERASVRFDKADRVLLTLGLDWTDVWDEAELPEVLASVG